jgi:hypothetical protein
MNILYQIIRPKVLINEIKDYDTHIKNTGIELLTEGIRY